ncbi:MULTISPECIES: hypothetical protein [unclassified Pseudomonas]|uniref:hypothetical protein n=1 Tax=unclassified Pseudomonas TaxID=196821 RepID=UPI0011B64441|nr:MULTISPECIES: hypothetical protein [unclassified Pseudomonas]
MYGKLYYGALPKSDSSKDGWHGQRCCQLIDRGMVGDGGDFTVKALYKILGDVAIKIMKNIELEILR